MKRRYQNDVVEIKARVDLRDIIQVEERTDFGERSMGRCPFPDHEDKTPSFLIDSTHYHCFGCGERGDLFDWLVFENKLAGPDAFRRAVDIAKARYSSYRPRRAVPVKKVVEQAGLLPTGVAEFYHGLLRSRATYFFARGFVWETIERQQFGWDGRYFTIPVWKGVPGKSGLLQVRRRAGPQTQGARYTGWRGYHFPVLYNREVLLHAPPVLVVFFGELDAALAWQVGIPAISPTYGCQNFNPEWLAGYDGRVVFVPDIGEEDVAFGFAGRMGARAMVARFPPMPNKESGNLRKDFTDFFNLYGVDTFVEMVNVQLGLPLDHGKGWELETIARK